MKLWSVRDVRFYVISIIDVLDLEIVGNYKLVKLLLDSSPRMVYLNSMCV